MSTPSAAWSLRDTPFRDPVNGFLHLAALLATMAGGALLIAACRPDGPKMLAAVIYVVSMAGCFLGSTLHHLVRGSRERELWLLRLDHAAIYPFIAGSYTPVCTIVLPGSGPRWLLAVVWAIAIAGVVYKLAFAPDPASVDDPPGKVDTGLYVAMGWLGVLLARGLAAHAHPGTVGLALACGVVYSLGAVILSRRWCDFKPGLCGHHEIWHVSVMAGAALYFAFAWLNLVV